MPIPKFTVIIDKVIGFVKTKLHDKDGNGITSTTSGTDQNLDVNIGSISGGVTANVKLHDGAGTALTSTLVGSDQSLDVNVAQSALPAGAAKESTLNSAVNELMDIEGYTFDIRANMPSRMAAVIKFSHGSVTANYANNNTGAVSQHASYNFICTAITVYSNTDPKVILQQGPITISVIPVLGGVPSPGVSITNGFGEVVHFEVPASTSWLSRVKLSASGNLDLDVYFHGYEVPT